MGLSTSFRRETNKEIVGYTNRCEDGRYIVFLDYDRIELEWIQREIKRLQEDFELGDFHIFRSGENNFHAVCLDKVSLSQLVTILQNSSVDRRYINVPLKYGRVIWTLRLTEKIKGIAFLQTISSKFNSIRMKSLAHACILHTLFKEDFLNNSPTDGSENVILARYHV